MNNGINIVTATLYDLWAGVVVALPEIIAALIIVIIGLIVSPILGKVAKKILQFLKIDSLSEKTGVKTMFEKAEIKTTFSGIVGALVKWFFLLVFFMAAVDVLGWTQVTEFLYTVVFFIPNVIVAVILVAIGLIAGQLVKDLVVGGLRASSTPIRNPELLGKLAKIAVIVFAVLAAALQLHIAEELIIIAFAGMVFALSLAFGLGGKGKAAQFLDRLDGSK